ncbi:MAG: ABC transporter substrate-binding protein [Gammaproteobacteria bacterium]|nr:ABC transporter substrate-binding protein [Gammaproteobacteria bacterium]
MRLFSALSALPVALASCTAWAGTTLVLESWRDDDRIVWEEVIAPAFGAAHPGIGLEFRPTAPVDYDAALASRLEAGEAGDLIACRPFDASLALYGDGHLADLGGLAGLARFPAAAKRPWQTDDGSATFCVPVASVIHGFVYNRDAFRELGIGPPETEAEFFAALERIREDGARVPLAMGVRDRWEAAVLGYDNIGPAYWKGEEGRRALIGGRQKLTDGPWVAPFRMLAKWRRYLGDGYRARGYRDSRDLFARGRAAVYPAGSWEIAGLRKSRPGFAMGAFRPPVPRAGDACHISDHLDMGIGLNAASPHGEAARVFLDWLGSAEFASLLADALPGFYPLSDHAAEPDDPLARAFVSWRDDCRSTIRFAAQYLSRGTPDLGRAVWDAAVDAITGAATAEEIGARLQAGLESRHVPRR